MLDIPETTMECHNSPFTQSLLELSIYLNATNPHPITAPHYATNMPSSSYSTPITLLPPHSLLSIITHNLIKTIRPSPPIPHLKTQTRTRIHEANKSSINSHPNLFPPQYLKTTSPIKGPPSHSSSENQDTTPPTKP